MGTLEIKGMGIFRHFFKFGRETGNAKLKIELTPNFIQLHRARLCGDGSALMLEDRSSGESLAL